MSAAGAAPSKAHGARLALLVFAVGCAAWAVALGQSTSWDLRNYHLYAPWAWTMGRFGRDLAPAHVQGFFNPALHFITLSGANALPPRVFAALLGFVQGLNALPLFALARRALPARLGARRDGWALALAVAGASCATALGELGATQGDNLVTLPFLCGLALLSRHPPAPRSRRVSILGGLLLGVAAGLKATIAPFALGALLASPLLAEGGAARTRLLVSTGLSAAAGFLVTAGPWMWTLWTHFGSPLFPLAGLGLSGTPVPPMALIDERFLPNGWVDALLRPLTILLHPRRVSDEWFRDLRLPLLFLSLPLLLLRAPGAGDAAVAVRRFLWVALAVGYPSWLLGSGYHRFLAPVEMLAPLLLATSMLARAPERHRWPGVVVAVLLVLMAATTRPPKWGHAPFADRFLVVQAESPPPDAIVVLAGDRPLAFLALAFGPGHDYLRISGSMLGPRFAPWWLDTRVAEALDRDARPVVALIQDAPEAVAADFSRFGLALESGCSQVRANLVPASEPSIQLCPVRRVRRADAALADARESWSGHAGRP